MRYRELFEQPINELMGVKRFQDKDAEQILAYFRNALDQKKIKILGEGTFGAAVKIGDSVYKFWMVDSAYEDFINYAMQHQSDPHMPKLYSKVKSMPAFFRRHEEAPDRVNYIKIEELEAINDMNSPQWTFTSDDRKFRVDFAEDVLGALMVRGRSMTWQYFKDRLSQMHGFYSQIEDKDVPQSLISLVQSCIKVTELAKAATGHYIDMHEGNFMLRGKQVVIIDPIANSDDLDAVGTMLSDINHYKPAVQSNWATEKEERTYDDGYDEDQE